MKNILFCLFGLAFSTPLMSQNGKYYYDEAIEKARLGQLDSAIMLFNASIAVKPDEYVAWYNRGIVKSMMGHYEDALADLEQTIKLNPTYKKAYFNRGMMKKHLANYMGALQDFTLATQLDTNYAEAYFERGIVYEMFYKKELACADYERAKTLGDKNAIRKAESCKDSSLAKDTHPILWLTKTADNIKYGFSPEIPVKVGAGPEGGIANEHIYLDLLRDATGNPVTYQKVSSCCAYASENARNGLAMVDKYEITFTNGSGETKTAFVYLSMYDYIEPMVLMGFKTVK
ncbi:MAG TPA: tetratricopeptide repeat protein [Chitinophagales bacterium]|nr:tetratricopeptide repeat protein [Chitinophagales bacterium]